MASLFGPFRVSSTVEPLHPQPVLTPVLASSLDRHQEANTARSQDAAARESAEIPAENCGHSQSDSHEIPKPSSLEVLYNSRPNVPSSLNYSVIKISNISWDTSIADVANFLAPQEIPVYYLSPELGHCIHIIMDRLTGKTINTCFVEFQSQVHAQRALRLHRKTFKGRFVQVELSSQTELSCYLFPNLFVQSVDASQQSASFSEQQHNPPATHQQNQDASSSAVPIYVTRDEIFNMLSYCKGLRSQSSRRCIRRPFENIVSILAKVPWHTPDRIPVIQRDHIFEMTKLSIESLCFHVQRYQTHAELNAAFVEVMVRAALCVPLFTEKQKSIILASSSMKCPSELEPFVYLPVDPSLETPQAETVIEVHQPQQQLERSSLQEAAPTDLKAGLLGEKVAWNGSANVTPLMGRLMLPNVEQLFYASPPSEQVRQYSETSGASHQHQEPSKLGKSVLFTHSAIPSIQQLSPSLPKNDINTLHPPGIDGVADKELSILRRENIELREKNRQLAEMFQLLKNHCLQLEKKMGMYRCDQSMYFN